MSFHQSENMREKSPSRRLACLFMILTYPQAAAWCQELESLEIAGATIVIPVPDGLVKADTEDFSRYLEFMADAPHPDSIAMIFRHPDEEKRADSRFALVLAPFAAPASPKDFKLVRTQMRQAMQGAVSAVTGIADVDLRPNGIAPQPSGGGENRMLAFTITRDTPDGRMNHHRFLLHARNRIFLLSGEASGSDLESRAWTEKWARDVYSQNVAGPTSDREDLSYPNANKFVANLIVSLACLIFWLFIAIRSASGKKVNSLQILIAAILLGMVLVNVLK